MPITAASVGFPSCQYQCKTFFKWLDEGFGCERCLQTPSFSKATETVIHGSFSVSAVMVASFTGMGVSVTAVHRHTGRLTDLALWICVELVTVEGWSGQRGV